MSAFLFAVECQWDGVDDVPVWTLLSVEPVSASYKCATEPFNGIKAIGSFVRSDRLQAIVEILQPLWPRQDMHWVQRVLQASFPPGLQKGKE